MTPRLAFRFIAISLCVFVMLMVVAVILNGQLQRQQNALATDDPLLAAISPDNMLMKLDANGTGAQVISGTHVSVALSPYPVRAGQTITVLVVGTASNGQIVPITPTLYVSPAQGGNVGDVLQVDLIAYANEAYRASQPFVPMAGVWRLRVHFLLNETDSSDVIFDVEAGALH